MQVGGVPVGSVDSIKITEDGQAEVEMSIKDDHQPLHVGTQAIRQSSLSGIANRYIDLKLPPDGAEDRRRRRDRLGPDDDRG